MTTTTAGNPVAPLRTRPTGARAVGVFGASLAALAVWTVTVPLLDVDVLVAPGGGRPQPVGAGTVVVTSLLVSLLGWALLALLEHRTARARGIWSGTAAVVLVLSLSGPLTGGTTTSGIAALALMHLAVAAVLIPMLRRSVPPSSGSVGTKEPRTT